jgi:photosystem II stability/assembly factor-like uncharacterized protein
MDDAPVLSLALSPNFAADNVLFAGTEEHGLFRSDNGGQSWTQLGQETITDSVNGILLSPEFSTKADIVVMLEQSLLVSRDGGQSWNSWLPDLTIKEGMASIVAPQGLDPDSPLLLGFMEGIVQKI